MKDLTSAKKNKEEVHITAIEKNENGVKIAEAAMKTKMHKKEKTEKKDEKDENDPKGKKDNKDKKNKAGKSSKDATHAPTAGPGTASPTSSSTMPTPSPRKRSKKTGKSKKTNAPTTETHAPTTSHSPTTMAKSAKRSKASGRSKSNKKTSAPTHSPTDVSVVDATRIGLKMGMYGIEEMPEDDQALYEQRTAAYIQDFYNENMRDGPHGIYVFDVEASVEVTFVEEPPEDTPLRNRRRLEDPGGNDDCQGDPLTVTYTMALSYRTTDPNLNPNFVFAAPFGPADFREYYRDNYLKADGEFEGLTCSSQVEFPETDSPTSSPSTETDSPTASPIGGGNSCQPDGACDGATGEIGDSSCNGPEACVDKSGEYLSWKIDNPEKKEM